MVSNSIQMLSQRLLLKLPEEIIVNHILPYTYLPMKLELSQDIKDFVKNSTQLKEFYSNTKTHLILFRDLITYLREISTLTDHVYISHKFVEIMSRHIMLKNLNHQEVTEYIVRTIVKAKDLNYSRFFTLLFGLMSIDERKSFMVDIENADTLYILQETTPEQEQILSD